MKMKYINKIFKRYCTTLGFALYHYVSLSVRPSDQHYLTTGMCNSHVWLTRFAEHHISRAWSVSENAHNSWTAWYIWLLIHILKLAGKMTKKCKHIKKKYWSCQDLNHCASGCWISRKPPRPPQMKYTIEQFTYIPFTCTPQIKIARPLSLD